METIEALEKIIAEDYYDLDQSEIDAIIDAIMQLKHYRTLSPASTQEGGLK